MNFLHRSFLLVALLLSAASARSFADPIITNGGFETGTFSGWTLVDTSSDTSVSSAIVNHGSYAAALGARGVTGTLSQTFADIAGASYTLYFYLSSDYSGTNTFAARIDGAGGFDLANVASGGFARHSVTFTGTGSDTVSFQFRDDAAFLRLDDVSFTDAGLGGAGGSGGGGGLGVAPEPPSMILLSTGLFGVAGVARFRYKAGRKMLS